MNFWSGLHNRRAVESEVRSPLADKTGNPQPSSPGLNSAAQSPAGKESNQGEATSEGLRFEDLTHGIKAAPLQKGYSHQGAGQLQSGAQPPSSNAMEAIDRFGQLVHDWANLQRRGTTDPSAAQYFGPPLSPRAPLEVGSQPASPTAESLLKELWQPKQSGGGELGTWPVRVIPGRPALNAALQGLHPTFSHGPQAVQVDSKSAGPTPSSAGPTPAALHPEASSPLLQFFRGQVPRFESQTPHLSSARQPAIATPTAGNLVQVFDARASERGAQPSSQKPSFYDFLQLDGHAPDNMRPSGDAVAQLRESGGAILEQLQAHHQVKGPNSVLKPGVEVRGEGVESGHLVSRHSARFPTLSIPQLEIMSPTSPTKPQTPVGVGSDMGGIPGVKSEFRWAQERVIGSMHWDTTAVKAVNEGEKEGKEQPTWQLGPMGSEGMPPGTAALADRRTWSVGPAKLPGDGSPPQALSYSGQKRTREKPGAMESQGKWPRLTIKEEPRSDGPDAREEDAASVRKEDLAVNHVSIEETRPLTKTGSPSPTDKGLRRQLADSREQLSKLREPRTDFQEPRTASEARMEAERFRWLQREAAPEAIWTGVRMLVTQNGHRGGDESSGLREYSQDDVRGMVAAVTERLNRTEKTLIAALEEIVDLRAWVAGMLGDAPAQGGGERGDQ